ncbi:MAG TPA: archaetidylserine decarboxylase [Terriglobales bacterium]|nr:archaetidylserine decarboxylase [Terriglobales bacterium]
MSEGEPTPWRARASRLVGRVARSPASRWLIPWFRWQYGIVLDEVEPPAHGYQSLQQFFCRPLRSAARPICPDAEALVSPVDGTLSQFGRLRRGELLQAKGRTYTLTALLGDGERAQQFEGGCYCTVYLAPCDYHRVHAPAAGLVREARYIPGAHWPVNQRAVDEVEGLFTVNERLITYLDSPLGNLALVLVGACLVGGIRVNFDPPWNAGPGPHTADRRRYDPAPGFTAGQELGRFEFGSTVILLAAPARSWEMNVSAGSRVRMGERLMRAAGPPETDPPGGC